MYDDLTQDWIEVNQKYLMAAIGRIRTTLEAHLEETEVKDSADLKTNESTALETLCTVFGLTSFERDILLLCVGMELDTKFIALCAKAQGDSRRPYPTFSLALAALPEPHWTAIVPTSPLRYWRLIETGPGETLTTSPLRVDERILHYLAGASHLDERLIGLVEPLVAPKELPPSHDNLVERIATHLSLSKNQSAVIQLCGQAGDGSHAIAAAACTKVGLYLQLLRARNIPTNTTDRETFLRLWEREAIISNSAILVDYHEMGASEAMQPAVAAFIEQIKAPVLVASRDPLRSTRQCMLRIDVNKPSTQEQLEIWQRMLGDQTPELNGRLPALVTQFHMHPQEIINTGKNLFNGQPVPENTELRKHIIDKSGEHLFPNPGRKKVQDAVDVGHAAGQGAVGDPCRGHHAHDVFIRNSGQVHPFQAPLDQPGQLPVRQVTGNLDALGQVFEQVVLPAHIGGADRQVDVGR